MSQKNKQSMNRKLRLVMIVFVVIATFHYLGVSRPRTVGTAIEISDLVDYADEQAKANIENVVATLKEEFDKEYSDPSLYFEDFSKERAELDTAYNETLESYFSDKIDMPYFTKTYNQYYLPALKKYRDGEISALEIIKNPEEYIRVIKFDMYAKYPGNYYSGLDILLYDYIDIFEAKGMSHYMFQLIKVKDDAMEKSAFYKMRELDDPYIKLRDENLLKRLDFSSDLGGNDIRYDEPDENLEYLEKQFNEKFTRVDGSYGLKGVYCDYYAPESDPTLKFPDRAFLKVYAQKAMYEEIEKIVEEEGYGKQIAHIAIPRRRDITIYDEDGFGYNPGYVAFDLSIAPDNKSIINEGYKGYYDITLNLLIEEGEEIDYAKLQRITARISDLFQVSYKEGDEPWERENIFIFFYTLPKEEQKIVVDLFKRDMITENYFRERTTLSTIYSDMYYIREETEGFHYLDTRAKKLEYLLSITGDYENIMSLPSKVFGERTRRESLIN